MIEAAATGQVDRIKQLIHNGETTNIVDNDGNSPLAFAVWNGIYPANRQVVEILLNNQADVRSRNKGGLAVIQQVIKLDDKEWRMQMIGKLVKFGAVISDKDNKGFDVLQKNVETYDTTTTEMMLDWWGRLISPAMLKSAKERAEEYNLGDVMAVLNKGVKPLVMDAHWNPAAIDKRTGLNDLHFAVINNDQKLVGKIVDKGVDINVKSEDEYGMKPLHYAVLHYEPEMVKCLLGHKAEVNSVNSNLNRPLHMIAWLNNPSVAKKIADILISNGAELNAKNKDGNTLLHMLIYNNNRGLINYLGKKYVFDLRIKNNDREDAEQLAERLQRKDILQDIKQ
jgi:ankyrin repeat protein